MLECPLCHEEFHPDDFYDVVEGEWADQECPHCGGEFEFYWVADVNFYGRISQEADE